MRIIKKHTSIKLLFTAILFSIITLSTKAQSTKRPDFSGTWLLDTAASQFNGVPIANAAVTEFSFEQQETYIALAKLLKDPKGNPYYFRDTLAFDGKPSMKIIPNQLKYTKTTTLKLLDDGKLVFSAIYKLTGTDGTEQTYASKETYSLSADGNTLTQERASVLPDRTERVTAVYHKKK